MDMSELSDLINDIGERVLRPDQGIVINIYVQGDVSETVLRVLNASSARFMETARQTSRHSFDEYGFNFNQDGSSNSMFVAVTESCEFHYHSPLATRTRIVIDERTGVTHLTYQMALHNRNWGLYLLGVIVGSGGIRESIDHVTYRIAPSLEIQRIPNLHFNIDDPYNKIVLTEYFLLHEHPGEGIADALREKGWALYESESPVSDRVLNIQPTKSIRNGVYYTVLPFDVHVDSLEHDLAIRRRQRPTVEVEDGRIITIKGIHCKEGLAYLSTTEMRDEPGDKGKYVTAFGFPVFRLPKDIAHGFSQYKPTPKKVH